MSILEQWGNDQTLINLILIHNFTIFQNDIVQHIASKYFLILGHHFSLLFISKCNYEMNGWMNEWREKYHTTTFDSKTSCCLVIWAAVSGTCAQTHTHPNVPRNQRNNYIVCYFWELLNVDTLLEPMVYYKIARQKIHKLSSNGKHNTKTYTSY